MTKFLRHSLLGAATLALSLAACSKPATKNAALSDDLKRDLKLASTSSLDLASEQSAAKFPLTEIPVESRPQRAPTIKKAPGPKAVRTPHPTVKAAPEPTVAAETQAPEAPTVQTAAAPTEQSNPEPSAPAVPRPSPIPVNVPSSGGGVGDGGGSGTGAVLGGIIGVILGGGGIDGDHCEPHGRGGRHYPNGGYPGGPGRYPVPGGRGTSPFPITPLTQSRAGTR